MKTELIKLIEILLNNKKINNKVNYSLCIDYKFIINDLVFKDKTLSNTIKYLPDNIKKFNLILSTRMKKDTNNSNWNNTEISFYNEGDNIFMSCELVTKLIDTNNYDNGIIRKINISNLNNINSYIDDLLKLIKYISNVNDRIISKIEEIVN